MHTTTTTNGFVSLKIRSNTVKPTAVSIIVDRRETTFTVDHNQEWVRLQYFREDFDDGKLTIVVLPVQATTTVTVFEIKMITDN